MNLFSNAGASQPASSAPSAPFGNLPTTSTASGPGLFAGLGASTSAPAGASTTTTSGGTGLFAGLGGAASSTAPSTSLFPGIGGAASQPQSTQQPASANPFGGNQSVNTRPRQSTNLYASSAQQQQQQPQAGGPLSQSIVGTSAHFDHLLERGRKRNAGEHAFGSFGELPTLQLGLGDIARKVRNLGQGGPSADQAQDRTA
jgi:nuclear pore complex protein Nup93